MSTVPEDVLFDVCTQCPSNDLVVVIMDTYRLVHMCCSVALWCCSGVLREVIREQEGAPEEVTLDLPGMDTAAAVAARQRLEARAAAEEDLMLRVPLSKAEAKKLKAQRRWVGGW